ncbi:MAG: endo alpha-1,4 polygalactosaminidase [Crocinitomix sp.]|nr:endo alpha-1,4 polygalactosaminidase [Crocinitomix sp.]
MKKITAIVSLTIICLTIATCRKKDVPKVDYANEMRKFVIEISEAAKAVDPDFLIIPQNGVPLATVSRGQDGLLAEDYLAAIDGQGQEDLFYGYDKDDKITPSDANSNLIYYLDLMEANGVEVLTTDYCSTQDKVLDSYGKNEAKDYVSFAATERNLTNIPDYTVNVHNENTEEIENLSLAKNFLCLINPTEEFSDKQTFINAIKETNYDLLILDRDFNDEHYTAFDIEELKWKNNGARRIVVCYMSIGEAEDYRGYWEKEWEKFKTSPAWLYKENKKWRGNYKVFYWMESWKNIIYGNENSYLNSLLDLGFDGTYLDIIDAYEYYEEL